jgi:hypothetical protein
MKFPSSYYIKTRGAFQSKETNLIMTFCNASAKTLNTQVFIVLFLPATYNFNIRIGFIDFERPPE